MKYALCNELFGNTELSRAAQLTKKAGYSGIEFAPFTVFGSFSSADVQAGIANIKKVLAENDLAYAGFHWVLVDPKLPMFFVSPDKAIRETAVERLRLLLSASGELGGGNLVLGSPKQRCASPGQSIAEAAAIFTDNVLSLANHAVKCNSTLLIESLAHEQCDVVNTLAQAKEIADSAPSPSGLVEGTSPGISGMFDFHNCGDETESWDVLIRKYAGFIKHVHINEVDGGPPGSGTSDYIPAFKALKEIAFDKWISMEIFTTPPDPFKVISDALVFTKKMEEL